MKNYGVFDILGPIMVGPSSSHTAGAARLGNLARIIVGKPFSRVDFYLHGSFAKTMAGHGTDKALLAGVLGMRPDDENLSKSFELAKEKNINFTFEEKDLGYTHSNTVKFVFTLAKNKKFHVTGSSIGGGNVLITNIDGTEIEFSGSKPTILVRNRDTKGVIAHISTILATSEVNIATMNVVRNKDIATMVIEVDSNIEESLINKISELKDIIYIKGINPIKE